VFSRSPFRSYYFISPTILMILTLLLSILVLIRIYERSPWASIAWIMIGCLAMVMFWLRALHDWRRLRIVANSTEITEATPLHVALEVAAAQLFWGLTYLCIVAAGLATAVGYAIHSAIAP